MKQTDTGANKAEAAAAREQSLAVNEQSLAVPGLRRAPAIVASLLLLFLAAGGGYAIWYASKDFTDLATRMTFIMGSALNLAIFLAIIAQACIYWGQRNLMHKQWEVLTEQSSTLKTQSVALAMQVQAMQGQLTAMQDQAESMRSQVRISKSQVHQVYKQVDLMGESLNETRNLVIQNERAVKAAERSIEIAQENMINSQRAWITIPYGEIKQPATTDPTFQLRVENSGNSPATKVQIIATADVRETEPPEVNLETVGWEDFGIIGPKSHMLRYVPTETSINIEQRRLLTGGVAKLYCWGAVRYEDIFGKERVTRFCFRQRLDIATTFGPCKKGNEAT